MRKIKRFAAVVLAALLLTECAANSGEDFKNLLNAVDGMDDSELGTSTDSSGEETAAGEEETAQTQSE